LPRNAFLITVPGRYGKWLTLPYVRLPGIGATFAVEAAQEAIANAAKAKKIAFDASRQAIEGELRKALLLDRDKG